MQGQYRLGLDVIIVMRSILCRLLLRTTNFQTKPAVLLKAIPTYTLKWSNQAAPLAQGIQIKTFTNLPYQKVFRINNERNLYTGQLTGLVQCTCLVPFPCQKQSTRKFNNGRGPGHQDKTGSNTVIYIVSVLIFMVGMSYAAVPLYKMFCQVTGLGGDPKLGHKMDKVETMEPIRERRINVFFNADHHAAMQWNFKPSQKMITVVPGETALAFYSAKNPTDKPIVGIATYNVLPAQAGLYFNKIQCFCFEEQWLNPHEEVDMPVFFYIDPDFDDDPVLADVDDVVLSYTFFKAEEGMTLPLPGFMNIKSVQTVNPAPA